jgi:hypothetical protein
MPEAPLQRPADAAVLHTLRGHVKALPSAVFDALDARFRPAATSRSLYLARPAAWLIIAQGGWWYRGEYRVVPDATGSNVEHVMFNVARTRWLGAFTGRKVIAEAPAASPVEAGLGVAAHDLSSRGVRTSSPERSGTVGLAPTR